MDLIVADTSVLINLERSNLRREAFLLPFRYVVPVLLYDQELRDYGGAELLELGLEVTDMTTEEADTAQAYQDATPVLSLPDALALALAASRSGMLLTGDRQLRRKADEEGVPCHGLLWLLDQMLAGAVAPARLLAGLEAIWAHPLCRLPKDETIKRIERFRKAATKNGHTG